MQPLSGNERPDLLTGPNISHEHVFCTAPATENASLQILFKSPMPAIVFRNATKTPRFAHFRQGALHLPRGTTSEHPKVVRTPGVFNILTSKCASRHNGVHFFDIATSKSGPTLRCFVHFDFEMCFAPQRRALFRHLNFQKWSGAACVLYILTSKCASRHNGVHFFDTQLPKVVRRCSVLYILTSKCASRIFAPQRHALFHLSSGQMAPHPPL